MNILKGIVIVLGFCAFGAAAFIFFTVGMLLLALRDGFMAVVHRLSGRRRQKPKVFYGGRDGVPNLVMDADGFVEPPHARAQAQGYGQAPLLLFPEGRLPAVNILQFPSDPCERQRLIDSRPQPAGHGLLSGDTVVSISGGKK